MKRENFDSDEEMYFYWWLEELQDLGYISKIIAQPKPFDLSKPVQTEYFLQMKTKTKYVPEEILKGHIYTCDFYVEWVPDKLNEVAVMLESDLRKKKSSSLQFLIAQIDSIEEGVYYSYIEVKPSFDQNNMTRLAKINQKWVFEKHGIFVNIVIPEKHFNKTFTPKRFFLTNKSGKPRSIKYKNIQTAKQFLG